MDVVYKIGKVPTNDADKFQPVIIKKINIESVKAKNKAEQEAGF